MISIECHKYQMGGTSEEMALGKMTDPSALPLLPVSSKLDLYAPALHGSSKIACNGHLSSPLRDKICKVSLISSSK